MATSEPPGNALRISFRSVMLGLFGGAFLCAFAPYNDWAMNNTFLIGNSMPLGAIMLAFLFVVLINGPLNRWRPSAALSSFEVAVAFMLMLAMCAIPTSGLVRYLLANLVMPYQFATENQGFRELLESLGVAKWVFPSFEGDDRSRWIGDPLATWFNTRVVNNAAVPYAQWLTPFISWGIFFGALFWALICMVCIMIRQWRDHEHLPFPLAHIQYSIIETPERGRWLNNLLSARSFWIAFAAVFLLHVNNGLYAYFPTNIVQISRGFDFSTILVEEPWNFVDLAFKKCVIYFSVIGVTYFLNSSVAFSLWFFFVLTQLYKMYLGTTGQDTGIPGLNDQVHGVAIAFFLSLVWLGRNHLRLVFAQAFRGERPGEAVGTYLSYRTAFWGIVGAVVVMIVWLTLAGTTLLGAFVLVGVLLIAYTLVTRVVAETGLIHSALRFSAIKPFELYTVYTNKTVPIDTFYLSAVTQATVYDYREVLPVYQSHGMHNVDQSKPDGLTLRRERQIGRRLIMTLCLALALGYGIAYFSALWTHYNYAVSMDVVGMSPIDTWGQQDNTYWQVMNPAANYGQSTELSYSPAGNVGFGFGTTALLSYLRLRFSWWPLHPVGYLMLMSFPQTTFWFSIFLGWVLKLLIVRVGSAKFYRACRPACIGLLLGETAAAGFWLVTSVVLNSLGMPYRAYLAMPQ